MYEILRPAFQLQPSCIKQKALQSNLDCIDTHTIELSGFQGALQPLAIAVQQPKAVA